MRRAICDQLRRRPLATRQLAACFAQIDRTTVMLRLRVLEDAGLVVPVRKGRDRFDHLDAMPIQAIHRRWIGLHGAGKLLLCPHKSRTVTLVNPEVSQWHSR